MRKLQRSKQNTLRHINLIYEFKISFINFIIALPNLITEGILSAVEPRKKCKKSAFPHNSPDH